jgi:hydroxymethylbilane synthase
LVLPLARHRRCEKIEAVVALLGGSPRIGTSSVRRAAQLARLFSHAQFEPIRGNLDTRLRKLDRGDYEVLVLAAAGLTRLGFENRISATVPLEACIPAPGQGIIAIEVRSADSALRARLAAVNDGLAAAALEAERTLVMALGGGCQMPIGGVAIPNGDDLDLTAIVVSLDGSRAVRVQRHAAQAEAAVLGRAVAQDLIDEGALEILAAASVRRAPLEDIQP